MIRPDNIKVTIIIKALNEEDHIEAAIKSALEAVRRVGGEVVLADSISTDRTVEIALRYPITIVQLKNAGDRRCGIGPQLGYQWSRGEYVYILDGDMELDPDFLPAAMEAMAQNPRLGGVAGLVEERSSTSYQFRGRKRRKKEAQAGDVNWLDMGGLYRRSALEQVQYFSNRNLHAFEEQELGFRLTYNGWQLRRLPVKSVLHHGYSEGTWDLVIRRWRSRYLDGAGEIIRASIGKAFFWNVVKQQKHLFIALAIWVCIILGLVLSPVTIWVLAAGVAALVLLIIIRARRTGIFTDAVLGQVVWQVTALAMVRGFFAPQVDPCLPIEDVVIAANKRAAANLPENK